MTEAERRAAIVEEAKSWLGTPFHNEARVKGHGVDCGQLLLGVYEAVCVIPHIETDHYSPDWHLHRNDGWYAKLLAAHARQIEGPPLPGDAGVWWHGRGYSHGAIVIEWPRVIHAYFAAEQVCWGDATLHPFVGRKALFFTAF